MKTWQSTWWLVAMLIAGACASSEREDARGRARCSSPGHMEICACPDATEGEQECREDGTFGPCECGSTPGGGGGSATGGSAGSRPEAGQSSGGRGGAPTGGAAGSAGTSSPAGMAGEAGGDPEGGTAGGGTTGAGAGGRGGMAGAGGTAGSGGSSSGGPCRAGDIAGCRCPDDALGYRTCDNAAFSACVCAGSTGTGGSGGCAPRTELCNQIDDDCNGVADDHFACPDNTVANTKPFSRAVYLEGRLSSLCTDAVLQRFWPTLSATPIRGFGCYTDWYFFRKADEVLFYSDAGRPYKNGTGTSWEDDLLLATPPCSSGGSRFGFDEEKTLHYQCGDLLYRGDGELIAGSVDGIVGVLDDGRIIVLREGPGFDAQYVVLSPQGRELVRFPPPGLFTGTLGVLPRATTLDGNTAYLALVRDYGDPRVRESIAYALDEGSNFRLVRRLVVAEAVYATLIVPDGTFFFRRIDSSRGYVVSANFANNTSQIVWSAADSPGIDTTNTFEFHVGPR